MYELRAANRNLKRFFRTIAIERENWIQVCLSVSFFFLKKKYKRTYYVKDKCFIFVLLLFIRISLICSEDLFWFTCISRDFDTNAKAKLQKGKTHTQELDLSAVSLSHGVFVLCRAPFFLSRSDLILFPFYNATNALMMNLCNTSHTTTYKTHTYTVHTRTKPLTPSN